LEVRRELASIWQVTGATSNEDDAKAREVFMAAVVRLGGTEKAVAKVKYYFHMPEWLAPDKDLAGYILSQCGENGVEPLRDLLLMRVHQGPMGRYIAVFCLGEIGPPAQAAIPDVVNLIVNYQYREFLDTLARIDPDGERTTQELVKWLADSDPKKRNMAVRSLGRLGSKAKSALNSLEQLVSDPECGSAAAKAIEEIGSASCTNSPCAGPAKVNRQGER
jgi:HEAT repeat protein